MLFTIKGNRLFIFLTAFLAPIKAFMFAVGALVVIDFIFGILAARKKGEKIESKKMSRTLVKMFVYQLLIISSHICEKYLVDFIPFTQITLGFLAIVEFYSIGESFSSITGMNFISYIKNIIVEKLKNKSSDSINIELPKKDDMGSTGFSENGQSEK
jgi:phage-related holin